MFLKHTKFALQINGLVSMITASIMKELKSLYFEETPFCKSFINIRNNKAISQDECGLFRTTLCLRKQRKLRKSFKNSQKYHFDLV